MDPFDHLNKHSHHIVAIFESQQDAEKAANLLQDSGIPKEHFSVLIRHGNEMPPTEAADDTLKDVVAGTAAGGALGFVLGAIAFGIPGLGTVIGAGLWTSTAIGAALGAATGIELSDFHHAWEGPYRAAIAEGKTLIAVSTDDAYVAAQAIEEFRVTNARQIDHFDRHGRATTPKANSEQSE